MKTNIIIKHILFLSLISGNTYAADMETMLNEYKKSSELSKITKSDSAGFVDVFTRDDLDRMQAKNLEDILKLISIPFTTREQTGVLSFTKPTQARMPNSAIRLFINDKPTASGIYGSTAKMYASMSLEHIDHIEIYTAASSIEFGGEPGSVIIKLYTKRPEREEAGKLSTFLGNDGTQFLNGYIAKTYNDDLSYLVSVGFSNQQKEEYENQTKPINSDMEHKSFFASLNYKGWQIDISHYYREADPFLGKGIHYTPEKSDGTTSHEDYIHISKTCSNGVKIKVLYSDLEIDEAFVDDGGIYAASLGLVSLYNNTNRNKTIYFSANKTFKSSSNELMLGTSYKYDRFETNFDTEKAGYSYDNSLDTYSFYLEDNYDFNDRTRLIGSFKYDIYRYKKEVDDKDEYTLRLGLIHNLDRMQFKAFYTDGYYLNPIASMYSNGHNAPWITNPNLKNPRQKIISGEIKYNTERGQIEFRTSYITVQDYIGYDPVKGFFNYPDERNYQQYELIFRHRFATNGKIEANLYIGDNGSIENMSPSHGAVIKLFNTYEKFDFYNELIYRGSYSAYGLSIDNSFNFTSSVKYRYSEDFSIGLRGENLFDDSYEQVYKDLPYAIPVYDRRVVLGLEYTF